MSISDVLVEIRGRTCVVTLNRPEARNSLTKAVVEQAAAAFDAASANPAVRCVVLRGTGNHFCAGADLRQTLTDETGSLPDLDVYMDAFHSVIKAIVRCPKPTIAQVDGAAVGFGADLALACDLRVVSDKAYIQEKFIHIGLMPDGGGTFWLPRLIGTSRAIRAIFLMEKLEASELKTLDLVVDVVPQDKLEARAMEIAKKLEKGPPLAFAEAKKALYANLGDVEAALKREREGQLRLLRTQDLVEGVSAWVQKREPDFQGK